MPNNTDQTVIDELGRAFEHLDTLAPPVLIAEVITEPETSTRSPGSRRSSTSTRRQSAVTIAAAAIVVLGVIGVWSTVRDDGQPSTLDPSGGINLADEGSAVTTAAPASEQPIEPEGSTAPPINKPSTSEGAIADRVAALDPWGAAQLFRVDAQYRASPAQAADLIIANELTSRDCYLEQGIDIPAFNPERLNAWEEYETVRWDQRRMMWTPEGQNRLRQEGNLLYRSGFLIQLQGPAIYPHATTPAPKQCYPAATGVTYLGGPIVWSENNLEEELMNGGTRWAPARWAFGRLPGTENTQRASDQCMLGRGWDQWLVGGAYQFLYGQSEASETEIDLMNDLIDCNAAENATATYLTTSADYVNEFRSEFANQITQIETERAASLAEAYVILRAAGLDPLSD